MILSTRMAKKEALVVMKNTFSIQVDSGMRHSTIGMLQDVKNKVTKLHSKFKAEKELVKLI